MADQAPHYKGSIDAFVQDEVVRIVGLADATTVAEKQLDGKRGRCPDTLAGGRERVLFGASDKAMLRWVERKARALPSES
jgi:hypothetical protein